jgi:hypothetical protein
VRGDPVRRLANRIYVALVPQRDHEWLRALVAELPAIEARGRVAWLLGVVDLLARAVSRRLFSDASLWWTGLAAGLLVAYLGLTLDSLTPHLVVLAVSVAALAFVAPDWAWRWGLLVSVPKPLFVEAGWYGPYFYDRFDAYYAVLPAIAIALAVAWSRGLIERRWA